MENYDPLAQYRQDVIYTATPEQLMLMLYREAQNQVKRCQELLPERPREGLQLTEPARNIFAALADNVNLGHPFGAKLRELYLYCWRTLLSAATSGDVAGLQTVDTVLRHLIAGLEHYREREAAGQSDAASPREPMSVNFAG
ncbi:MAG: flagellar protein FliS [Firmicutes bacterium]|nr:flagellar protein FliS [Bacillota bacterium]